MLCDLHLHTTKSDGVLRPEALFDEVRSRGLHYFSITDHDCIGAYPVPEDLRDRAIGGMEVDTHHAGDSVHILAYGEHDERSPLLQALLAQRSDRLRRMEAMVGRLAAMGIGVTLEDVLAHAPGARSLGRPHLARALVAKGHVKTVQEAFDRYIADDGGAYEPLARLTSEKALGLIRESACVSVIAHPMRLANRELLDDVLNLRPDGIEVVHPTASPEDESTIRALARERDLVCTGGTDFHAPVTGRPIGIEFAKADIDALLRRVEMKKTA